MLSASKSDSQQLSTQEHVALLQPIFADDRVLKVVHGAFGGGASDGAGWVMQWLKKSLDLHAINVFDTFFASKVLDFKESSLAHLLEQLCGVVQEKKYQLANWKRRPLTEAQLQYAVSETQYLLHLHDQLKSRLRQRSGGGEALLLRVYQQSTEESSKAVINLNGQNLESTSANFDMDQSLTASVTQQQKKRKVVPRNPGQAAKQIINILVAKVAKGPWDVKACQKLHSRFSTWLARANFATLNLEDAVQVSRDNDNVTFHDSATGQAETMALMNLLERPVGVPTQECVFLNGSWIVTSSSTMQHEWFKRAL